MLCEIATRTYLFRPYNSKDTSFFVHAGRILSPLSLGYVGTVVPSEFQVVPSELQQKLRNNNHGSILVITLSTICSNNIFKHLAHGPL